MLYRDDVPNVEVGVEIAGSFAPTGRIVASALPAGRVPPREADEAAVMSAASSLPTGFGSVLAPGCVCRLRQALQDVEELR